MRGVPRPPDVWEPSCVRPASACLADAQARSTNRTRSLSHAAVQVSSTSPGVPRPYRPRRVARRRRVARPRHRNGRASNRLGSFRNPPDDGCSSNVHRTALPIRPPHRHHFSTHSHTRHNYTLTGGALVASEVADEVRGEALADRCGPIGGSIGTGLLGLKNRVSVGQS